jgi:hypothetical protein
MTHSCTPVAVLIKIVIILFESLRVASVNIERASDVGKKSES